MVVKDILGAVGLREPLGNAWRTVKDQRKLRQQFDIWRDLQQFRARYGGFLQEIQTVGPAPRTLLIISLADTPFQAKLEGMMAKALQLRGYHPRILTGRNTHWVQRYLREFGLRDFIYLDDYSQQVSDLAHAEASRLLAEPMTVRRMKDLNFRGADVGRHVLSIATRNLKQGAVEPSDPRFQQQVARLLPQSIQAVLAAEQLLDTVRPDLVLFHEARYAVYGALCDVALARGLNVIQFQESPHGSDTLQWKRHRFETRKIHPQSLSDDTWERLLRMPWTPRHEERLWEQFRVRYAGVGFLNRNYQFTPSLRGADKVHEILGLDPSKKTAVIFPHVLWDANLFFGEDLFSDQEDWLVQTVKAACANPDVNWIVKVHPANGWKRKRRGIVGELREVVALRKAVGELPPHVKLLEPTVDINTFDLFGAADYGLTIRGTIGIELPCFGVPVFTGGTGRYSGKGFTIDSATPDEFFHNLAHIQDFPRLTEEQTIRAKKYAYGLFHMRPWRMQSMHIVYSPIDLGGHPLEINIDLRVRSARELAESPDLVKFAAWADDPTRLDFLEEEPEESPLPASPEPVPA